MKSYKRVLISILVVGIILTSLSVASAKSNATQFDAPTTQSFDFTAEQWVSTDNTKITLLLALLLDSGTAGQFLSGGDIENTYWVADTGIVSIFADMGDTTYMYVYSPERKFVSQYSDIGIECNKVAIRTITNTPDEQIKTTSPEAWEEYLAGLSENSQSSANGKSNSLTDIEAEVFEWLTNSISNFHSPTSVRVVEVLGKKDDMYYISISAETLGGGTSNELYELEKYSCEKSMFVSISKIKNTHFTLRETIYGEIPSSSECDVGNINNALKEFYVEKGWN